MAAPLRGQCHAFDLGAAVVWRVWSAFEVAFRGTGYTPSPLCKYPFEILVGPRVCGGFLHLIASLMRKFVRFNGRTTGLWWKFDQGTGRIPNGPISPKSHTPRLPFKGLESPFPPMRPSGTSKPLKRHLELLHFWNTFSTCQVRTPTRQQCTSSHCDSHSQSLIRA